jgi:hypothetical protein
MSALSKTADALLLVRLGSPELNQDAISTSSLIAMVLDESNSLDIW